MQYPQNVGPGMQQPMQPMQPPKKKGMSGCMMAFLIVSGIGLVIGIVVLIVVVRFLNSPDGQKLVGAVKEGASAVQEAQNAPGTTELKGMGCVQPMVMDTQKLSQSIGDIFDAGPMPESSKQIDLIVTCPVPMLKSLECNDVAKTYVKAVGGKADKKFTVSVQTQGGSQLCTHNYDTDGSEL
jgi:hypothetical protein